MHESALEGAQPCSCRAGWSCSACRRCRTRPCRRWPRWRAIPRSCWPCPIPASSTGATSSKGASCCARAHKRQRQKGGIDLGAIPLEELHAHSNPLLASWGRQGRDFVRMLDEFDNANSAPGQMRIDLFSEGEGVTLLEQVQAAVRDMLPLHEHPRTRPEAGDRSIEFHVAHSVQREVEILHDQLLSWFGA
ncbi:exodeoxyribonuclease V subunit gamma [Massilia sp. H-1]|nr:exodeoxyribonuclease V subunit gamma [Massilia sp. H-1]